MKKQGLTQQAYKAIKELILTNKLVPGQLITEAEMQESLGFGRTPIREAFLELTKDQLVEIHPRKGIEICSFSPKKIRDIFEARALIEPPILYQHMEKLDRDWLLSVKSIYLPAAEPTFGNPQDVIVLHANKDDEFHRSIVNLIGNTYINRLMDSFFDYLTMIRIAVSHNVDRYHASNLEHVEIIDAILNDDRDLAKEKLTQHLYTSLDATLQNFLNSSY